MLLSVAAVTLGLLIASIIIFHYIHSVQYEPYMDEVFHVPQAKEYCAGNFSNWDPMITTLPGLYISSLVMLYPFSLIGGKGDLMPVCTTYRLRAGNLFYCCGNFILLFLLSKLLYLKSENRRGHACHLLMNALTLCVFPVLYFFTWLYYTDPGAVFFTLFMYYLCLRDDHSLASLTSVVAILFRQTNVIWVLFCLSLKGGGILERRVSKEGKIRSMRSFTDWQAVKTILSVLFSKPQTFFSIVGEIVFGCIHYLLVLFCFCLFVYMNNGIVVGDRSNHQVSLNFPQVFYFLAISAAFSFIHLIHPYQILSNVKTMLKNPLKVILFVGIAYYFIKNFTYEHKYTLSDNRHYTFYVWSKIFKRWAWVKYAAILVYLYSSLSFYSLTFHKGFLWRLSTSVCIILCLVPQALLEFRYYIIPYYIIRLNMPLPSKKALFVELIAYIAINSFTIYMFAKKPFFWPNDPDPQRFMW